MLIHASNWASLPIPPQHSLHYNMTLHHVCAIYFENGLRHARHCGEHCIYRLTDCDIQQRKRVALQRFFFTTTHFFSIAARPERVIPNLHIHHPHSCSLPLGKDKLHARPRILSLPSQNKTGGNFSSVASATRAVIIAPLYFPWVRERAVILPIFFFLQAGLAMKERSQWPGL